MKLELLLLLLCTYGLLSLSINIFLLKIPTPKISVHWRKVTPAHTKPESVMIMFGITMVSTLMILFFAMTIAHKQMRRALYGVLGENDTGDGTGEGTGGGGTGGGTTGNTGGKTKTSTGGSTGGNTGKTNTGSSDTGGTSKPPKDKQGCILQFDEDCSAEKYIMFSIGGVVLLLGIVALVVILAYKYS